MDKIDVMKIEQSSLSGLEKIVELQMQTTNKINELVEEVNVLRTWIDEHVERDKKYAKLIKELFEKKKEKEK